MIRQLQFNLAQRKGSRNKYPEKSHMAAICRWFLQSGATWSSWKSSSLRPPREHGEHHPCVCNYTMSSLSPRMMTGAVSGIGQNGSNSARVSKYLNNKKMHFQISFYRKNLFLSGWIQRIEILIPKSPDTNCVPVLSISNSGYSFRLLILWILINFFFSAILKTIVVVGSISTTSTTSSRDVELSDRLRSGGKRLALLPIDVEQVLFSHLTHPVSWGPAATWFLLIRLVHFSLIDFIDCNDFDFFLHLLLHGNWNFPGQTWELPPCLAGGRSPDRSWLPQGQTGGWLSWLDLRPVKLEVEPAILNESAGGTH